MDAIKDFSQLVDIVKARAVRPRVAVVWAADTHTQEALSEVLSKGLADVVFVGAVQEVEQSHLFDPYRAHISFVSADNPIQAATRAVRMIREGKADVLMKGLINTDDLLRVILNKEEGLLSPGRVMTHVTAALLPTYSKLLFFTDAAVLPHPSQEQRIEQVRYIVDLCHRLGVEEPRLSLIHCTEKVNEKHFPFTAGYRDIIEKSVEGLFGRCIVDGPLDVKTSLDLEALRTKKIDSPIEGRADALIFPDIISGNVFYKTISLFPGVETAAMLLGLKVPVVLTSRGDSMLTKFYSVALTSV